MAPAGKFVLNRKVAGQILKHDPLLARAVDDVAEQVAHDAGPNATVDHYTTDRHVGGVVVPAADQARSGTATRAAQGVASRAQRPSASGGGARPFTSRAAWRRAFAAGESSAADRARASRPYASLPERKATSDA